MNRRTFCRLASLAALATGLRGSAATVLAGGSTPPSLPRCRITVLRRECFDDLQSRYLDDPETGPCTLFTEGQTFITSSHTDAPRGFCPHAWECISRHVAQVLSASPTHCGLSLPDNGAVIACCNDGTRPVIFKIEPL